MMAFAVRRICRTGGYACSQRYTTAPASLSPRIDGRADTVSAAPSRSAPAEGIDELAAMTNDQIRGFDRAQTAKATKIVPSPYGDQLVGRGDRLACRPLRCFGAKASDRPRWLAVIRLLVRVCPVRMVRYARSRWWSAGVACSSQDRQCRMADGCASTP